MIHLTDEEYDNLLRQIDEKTECIALYAKEKNEQKLRADRAEKRWSELKKTVEKAETSWAVEELLYGKSSTSKEYRNYLKALLKMMHDLEEDVE